MIDEKEITEAHIEAENFVLRHKLVYDTGNAILAKLFLMNKDEIKAKIESVCGDKLPNNLTKNCHVIKTSEDDIPSEIVLVIPYARVIITWFGIELKADGSNPKELVAFDEHFKL